MRDCDDIVFARPFDAVESWERMILIDRPPGARSGDGASLERGHAGNAWTAFTVSAGRYVVASCIVASASLTGSSACISFDHALAA